MASPYRPPPPPPLELELTIVSAKHLKNVNWRTGALKPYCVFWVDPTFRLCTKSDDSGSTRPVWNERFTLPLPTETARPDSSSSSYLTLEVFHSKPSETPKPLVGTLRISLADLTDPDDSNRVRNFELARPSGRPQGKIRVKIGIRPAAIPPPAQPHLHDYGFAPPAGYYYNPATPPPPRDYARYSRMPYAAHPLPHQPSFYDGYYASSASASAVAPPPPRPMAYGAAPSAPVDAYQRQRGGGLAMGAVAGGLGGLALDEGSKDESKVVEKTEGDFSARNNCSNYHDYY